MADREIRTILLVDGSASFLFYLAMLLKRLEYKVGTARSAEEALRMMELSAPSIVLTELALPQMSGLNFLKTVKNTTKFKGIPVVILTAEKDAGTRETCMRMGCAAYLNKPAEPDVLYRTLQAVSESVPRANIRLSASVKVIVGDSSMIGVAKRTEYANAISEGGLYIKTLHPYPRNTLIPLVIFLNDREINVRATVLYTFAPGEGPFQEPGIGVKFVEISDTDRRLIRAFIKEQLTRDLASPGNRTL